MPRTLTWTDRLRIQRAVWTVDILTSDLPHRSQRALVRELRANLRSAAAEVGAAEAVRQLGSLGALARGYLEAQFGEAGPRPSILRGLFWATVVYVGVLVAMFTGFGAFIDGLQAADAHASGTYSYQVLMASQRVTLVNGEFSSMWVSFSALPLLALLGLLAATFLLGARAWRWLPFWRR